jgi:Cu(I)/Ag(I) efflux system membrane protein CusA/SilA
VLWIVWTSIVVALVVWANWDAVARAFAAPKLGANPATLVVIFTAILLGGTAVAAAVVFGVVWLTGQGRLLAAGSTMASLLLVAVAARQGMTPLGREFMPPLDEGTILDMPVTVPRASITQASDDLKARDAMLRQFPEVELVVGKAGRAETPTDPAPPDMIETVVNLRPRELWPKRQLRYEDAWRQTSAVLAAMEQRGWVHRRNVDKRNTLVNDATMAALARFDATMRELALAGFAEIDGGSGAKPQVGASPDDKAAGELVRHLNWKLLDAAGPAFTWLAIEEVQKGARANHDWLAGDARTGEIAKLRAELAQPFGRRLLLWQKSKGELVEELDTVVRVPGWGNIWTQPIINRVDMLATGVRTMIGVKVYGDDLDKLQPVVREVAEVLRKIPGAVDVTPDQLVGEGYLEIDIDREKAARYGVNVGDVQDVVETALGGQTVTTTVEGRERYPVRIRYARDFRVDEESVKQLLVSGESSPAMGMGNDASKAEGTKAAGSSDGGDGASAPQQVPLSMVADVRVVEGPSMIKSEDGRLRAYVQLNVRDRDIVGFVEEARRAVSDEVTLPEGVSVEWSGQFEHQVRARKSLTIIFPLVFALIFLILYITYHDLADTLVVLGLAAPGAIAGGVLFQYLFGFNFSVAVWVGYIACFGLSTENGLVMLVYLREAIAQRGGLEKMTLDEVKTAVLEGAVHRTRPKLLTEVTAVVGLAPMLWATGTGAEIMRPMAAPVLGGILVSDEVVDLLLPVLFFHVRRWRWKRLHRGRQVASGGAGVAQSWGVAAGSA